MRLKRPFEKLKVPLSIGMIALAAGFGWTSLKRVQSTGERAFEFTEKVQLEAPKDAREIRIWIPVPADDFYQQTEILGIDTPLAYKTHHDEEFGNRILYMEWKPNSKNSNTEIHIRYKITRKERRGLEGKTVQGEKQDQVYSQYLNSRGLEVINRRIQKLSDRATRGIKDPVRKAEAIYQYVFENMKYDKTGKGWGRGDSVYACEVGKGNCTDFHSLFITMARASKIPARFQMGIPLPQDAQGIPAASYHCWAEFYVDGRGWIPVDISEAWKNPKKKKYFFGNLDSDRLLLTKGREIRLSPEQAGAPLNYFSKPYVEVDGKSFKRFKIQRLYKNLDQL